MLLQTLLAERPAAVANSVLPRIWSAHAHGTISLHAIPVPHAHTMLLVTCAISFHLQLFPHVWRNHPPLKLQITKANQEHLQSPQ